MLVNQKELSCSEHLLLMKVKNLLTPIYLAGLRLVHTKTDPSYIYLMEDIKTSKCKSGPSMMVDASGFFAPVETKLFRTILKEQCKKPGVCFLTTERLNLLARWQASSCFRCWCQHGLLYSLCCQDGL